MPNTIDATGKACPIPFMLAKKAIDANERLFTVLVDNQAAVENLKKLAHSQGYTVDIDTGSTPFPVTFRCPTDEHSPEADAEPSPGHAGSDYILFLGKDTMGSGSQELGRNLMRMFLYTVGQTDELPSTIVCMNNGALLATVDAQCVQNLKVLEQRGVEILVCGTCLDYHGLLDKLQVGTVANMYEITNRLVNSPRVIAL